MPQSNDIYTATIAGWSYFGDEFVAEWSVTWPCGAETQFDRSETLYKLGEAIAEHRDNCKMGCT